MADRLLPRVLVLLLVGLALSCRSDPAEPGEDRTVTGVAEFVFRETAPSAVEIWLRDVTLKRPGRTRFTDDAVVWVFPDTRILSRRASSPFVLGLGPSNPEVGDSIRAWVTNVELRSDPPQ